MVFIIILFLCTFTAVLNVFLTNFLVRFFFVTTSYSYFNNVFPSSGNSKRLNIFIHVSSAAWFQCFWGEYANSWHKIGLFDMQKTTSPLARMILAIPASSIKSEKTFSTCGNFVTQKRTRLAPNKIEKLVITRLKSKVFSLESWDIADMDKCPQEKCCMDKCHGDSCNLLYMFPGPFV